MYIVYGTVCSLRFFYSELSSHPSNACEAPVPWYRCLKWPLTLRHREGTDNQLWRAMQGTICALTFTWRFGEARKRVFGVRAALGGCRLVETERRVADTIICMKLYSFCCVFTIPDVIPEALAQPVFWENTAEIFPLSPRSRHTVLSSSWTWTGVGSEGRHLQMGGSSQGNSTVCNGLSHHTYPDLNTLLLSDVKAANGLLLSTFHLLRKSLFTNEDELSSYSDNICIIAEFQK